MPGNNTFAQHLDNQTLRVIFEEAMVGTLALDIDGLVAFEYDENWLQKGFSISPLSLPLKKGVFTPKAHPFEGLFGVFADSLPDGWGRLLVDRLLLSHGVDPASIDSLNRLAIIGNSGMGGLKYEPAANLADKHNTDDLDALGKECASILRTNYSENLDELFALGGSSGGARPKILTEYQGEPWIIKFPSSYDQPGIGKVEYTYAQTATACGIEIPETKLFPSKICSGYFGVKRFDRIVENADNVHRVHMISAGALLEASHRVPSLDYSILMKLVLTLTDSMLEVEKLYRLMCFNVFSGNKDDHAKNFSFIYHQHNAAWQLSPAYDLTPNPGMNGEHATTVAGKGRDIEAADLIDVGTKAGITHFAARAIVEDIFEKTRVLTSSYKDFD